MTETIRRPEVTAAAEWWADVMARPGQQDIGDAFQSGFATALAMTVAMRAPMTDAEKLLFTERIATRLEAHVAAGWDRATTEPGWGTSFRCIGVDYGPCLLLASALIAAVGQTRAQELDLLWPLKTRMWIDPGCVKVSHGYRAEPVVIYPKATKGTL